jgi:hypothetical protein
MAAVVAAAAVAAEVEATSADLAPGASGQENESSGLMRSGTTITANSGSCHPTVADQREYAVLIGQCPGRGDKC